MGYQIQDIRVASNVNRDSKAVDLLCGWLGQVLGWWCVCTRTLTIKSGSARDMRVQMGTMTYF